MGNIDIYYSVKYGMFEGKIDGKVVSRAKSEDRVRDTVTKILKTGSARNKGVVKTAAKKAGFVVDLNVRNRVTTQVAEVSKHAEKLFGVNLQNMNVSFFNRGAKAGFARYRTFEVGFNEVLARDNPNEFLNVVRHEIAHHVVRSLFPMAKPHGREFKNTLIRLGGDGKTYHSMDVSNCAARRTKFRAVYECLVCGRVYKVSKVTHAKVQRGGHHCHCGGAIKFQTMMEIK